MFCGVLWLMVDSFDSYFGIVVAAGGGGGGDSVGGPATVLVGDEFGVT